MHVQGASEASLEDLDNVHLMPASCDYLDDDMLEVAVESLARFTVLRSLTLRWANGSRMNDNTPPLASGLRQGSRVSRAIPSMCKCIRPHPPVHVVPR